MQAILDLLKPYLEALSGQFGIVAQALAALAAVVGSVRLVTKPLFTFLHAVADATPSQIDNKLLDDVEQSKVMAALKWLADYILSVKLPPKQ